MIKLALMRTTTGMEDPKSNAEDKLPASKIVAQINASQSSSNRDLNINCSEENV
jgi:hypothetical protein